jgi:hypothetical protein
MEPRRHSATRARRAVAVAGALAAAAVAAAPAVAIGPELDVVIALDTTAGMDPTIQDLTRDAAGVVADVRRTIPGARFALTQFRDVGDDPEYELVQPLTGSGTALADAASTLSGAGGGDSAEGYAAAFEQTSTDPAIGYRPEARRLLIVIGDAEPHGARTAGIPGCLDDTEPPNGLTVGAALTTLQDNLTTLSTVLQGNTAQTSITCYRSLAARGYGRGLAVVNRPQAPGPLPLPPRPGRPGVINPRPRPDVAQVPLRGLLVRLVREALPTLRLTAPRTERRGQVRRWTVRVRNPVPEPLTLNRLVVTLPRGYEYVPGTTLGVTRADPLVHGATLAFTPRARTDGEAQLSVSFIVRAPGGGRVHGAAVSARFRLSDDSLYAVGE